MSRFSSPLHRATAVILRHLIQSRGATKTYVSAKHLCKSPSLLYFFHRNAWVLCAGAIISSADIKFLSPEALFKPKIHEMSFETSPGPAGELKFP